MFQTKFVDDMRTNNLCSVRVFFFNEIVPFVR